MRWLKKLFSILTALLSFAGVVYLFEKLRNDLDDDPYNHYVDSVYYRETGRIPKNASQPTDVRGMFYKGLDSEEIASTP
ncbi:MAG: hypothetical protein GY866_12785 [Proteobacteria bacterium]|nr:hypothetical protein [Pseudomonadota bacterium]